MRERIVFGIISGVVLIIMSAIGFWVGWNGGYTSGNTTGFELGKVISYEKGYVSGYDNGKEFVVTHLDQYVKVPKAVKYDEVVAFIKNDRTDEVEYSEQFNCVTFANVVKDNAEDVGIKCGVVSFDLKSGQSIIGHAINIFDTSDKGKVYFSPQDDGQRYGIYVGGTYVLQGITYKITKVDVIW